MILNSIYCIDVLDGLKQLEDKSIDLIIFSPPYNKHGLRNQGRPVTNNNLKSASAQRNWVQSIPYGGDYNVDNMKEEDYEQWQIEILNECFRILKDDGSVFYNHKNRLFQGEVYSPYKWLFKTPFKIRQEIVWDMGGSPIQAPIRWLPTTERIYWLAKGKETKFHRNKDGEFKTEVWKIHRETRKNHPAPYPIKLVDTILDGFPNDEKLIVLDPFCGSGTTCISAIKKGYDYLGFDKFQEYVNLTNERIKKFKENEK